ncbi:MAG: carbohydrate porin [Alphaproteobacteria bacterium]|nr:carbohydrate porin [Alphaproteobacteria bacterium]
MSRQNVFAGLALLFPVATAAPAVAQQQGAGQDANIQGFPVNAVSATTAAVPPESVPPRKDRRVGKLHDRLRAQKAQDDADRETATGLEYDYLAFKKELETSVGLTFQIPPTAMIQWGEPNGGASARQRILEPSVNWDMFDSPDIGRGSIQFGYTYNKYWSRQTGVTLSNRLGVLSPVNDYPANTYHFSTLTYTHEFPGDWLELVVGQYQFGAFDSNQYASNVQKNFINYALSQNGSQAYIPDSLGGYAQANPTSALSFAAGLQNAQNVTGDYIETSALGRGPWAWFAYGQWTPTFPFLAKSQSAQYSLLYYEQPSVPEQPVSGQGWSLNAVQNLNATWGLFARANHSTGPISPIATSLAGGVIYNNPSGLDPKDQIGLGLAWNVSNRAAFVGQPTRHSETVAEAYWNFVFFKFVQVGPDLQVILNPALCPKAGTAEVFTFRLTGLF